MSFTNPNTGSIRNVDSDVVLRLSRLFQIDASTDWTLCYEQVFNLTMSNKGLIMNCYCTIYWNLLRLTLGRGPRVSAFTVGGLARSFPLMDTIK